MTTFSPPDLYRCPNCSQTLEVACLTSGNTIGARIYSDGYRYLPMLPARMLITVCPDCREIFWLDDKTKLGNMMELRFSEKLSAEKFKEAAWLELEDYIKALDAKLYRNKNEERYLRIRTMWTFNHPERKGEEKYSDPEIEKAMQSNFERLTELLDKNQVEGKIMTAEICRYNGEFHRCLELIASIDSIKLLPLKKGFYERCESEDTKVFEIDWGTEN